MVLEASKTAKTQPGRTFVTSLVGFKKPVFFESHKSGFSELPVLRVSFASLQLRRTLPFEVSGSEAMGKEPFWKPFLKSVFFQNVSMMFSNCFFGR